jgi:hypothetical protein
VVKLSNAQQDMLTRASPAVFAPVPGGWGERGATHIFLKHADKAMVQDALRMAWRNTAPKSLIGKTT